MARTGENRRRIYSTISRLRKSIQIILSTLTSGLQAFSLMVCESCSVLILTIVNYVFRKCIGEKFWNPENYKIMEKCRKCEVKIENDITNPKMLCDDCYKAEEGTNYIVSLSIAIIGCKNEEEAKEQFLGLVKNQEYLDEDFNITKEVRTPEEVKFAAIITFLRVASKYAKSFDEFKEISKKIDLKTAVKDEDEFVRLINKYGGHLG